MTDLIRLAARVTAQQIRLDQQQHEIDALRVRLATLEHTLKRITRAFEKRGQSIDRLRSRVTDARRSRDLWKHRYRRDVT